MNRFASAVIAAAVSATVVTSAQADYLPVFGATATLPSGATVYSFLSQVPAGEGVGAFNISASSGSIATRFDAFGNVQNLSYIAAPASGNANASVNFVAASGLALGSASQGASSASTRAVYWLPGSATPVMLNSINDYAAAVPGQSTGVANSMNAGGMIVGQSQRYSDDGFAGLGTRAVYWTLSDANHVAVELGNLGTTAGPTDNTGVTNASAVAVNNSGVIVGFANNIDTVNRFGSGNHAVKWDTAVGTQAIDLNVLNTSTGLATGSGTSSATAINSSGTIIGSSTRYDVARYQSTASPAFSGYAIGTRAVRWDAGSTTPTELQPLSTTTFDVYNSRSFAYTYAGTGGATATDINDAGLTVGYSTLYAPQTGPASGPNLTPATYGTRAVYWAAGSTTPVQLPYLGTLSGGTSTTTQAYAINEDGVIAGSAYQDGVFTANRAVVWRTDRSIVNLNGFVNPASGYVLTTATAISEALNTNSYTVTGIATYNGATQAYLINLPRPMYFANTVGGDLASVSGGQTNFATNVAGTNISTQLPTGGNDVFFASSNAASLSTTLGSNFAVNSLTFGTGASSSSPVAINGTGTLTLNGGLSVVYNAGTGILKNSGSAAVTINAPVAVAASQSWTNNSATALTVTGGVGLGSNTLTVAGTGNTAITGAITGTGGIVKTGTGTLSLSTPAQAAVLTGGGADLQGGKLLLDYTGGTSPVASVKSILDLGYAGNFATGQIKSTTLAAGRTIGYGDNGTDTVTLRITLAGDADLDGNVDFNDFLVLQSKFGQANTRFDEANFNYDGFTDFNDFLALQANFGQSVTGDEVAFTSAQVAAMTAFASVVPEPASLTLIGMGAAGLLGRRRRASATF
ncbi:MAG: DUF3466 family protein [Tepidisphaeraceae bacterium]